ERRGGGTHLGDGGCHVLGVEGTGDLQGHDARLGGRLGGEGSELVEGAGGDHLAAPVDVGGGEAVAGDRRGDLVRVAADDGAHPGGGDGGGVGHRPAAHPDEVQGVAVGEHAGDGRGGELAHGVPGRDVDRARLLPEHRLEREQRGR